MNEPERLLDQERDDLAARLLRSASADGPDERSRARALASVALAAAATGAASSAAAATSSILIVLKWIGLGALVGGVVGITVDRVLAPTERAPDPTPVGVLAPAPKAVDEPPASDLPTSAEPLRAEPARERRTRAPSAGASPSPIASERADGVPSRSSVAAFAAPASPKSSLGDELREVDRARRRLASGDPAAALADIAAYERRYPRGRLLQEARLLRIEALGAAGRCDEARAAASGFLVQHPDSVLAKRARTLLARCQG